MALTRGTQTTDSASSTRSLSFSHSVDNGNNRLLVVFVHMIGSTDYTWVDSITYGGNALTQGHEGHRNLASGEIWYLKDPPTGSNTLSISTDAGRSTCTDLYGTAVSYTDAGTLDATANTGNWGSDMDLDLTTTVADTTAVQIISTTEASGSITPDDSQTELADNSTANGTYAVYELDVATATTQSMDATLTSGDNWASVAVNFTTEDSTTTNLACTISASIPTDTANLSNTVTVLATGETNLSCEIATATGEGYTNLESTIDVDYIVETENLPCTISAYPVGWTNLISKIAVGDGDTKNLSCLIQPQWGSWSNTLNTISVLDYGQSNLSAKIAIPADSQTNLSCQITSYDIVANRGTETTASDTSTRSVTFSHTVDAGNGRLLVVAIGIAGDGDWTTVTDVTWDGTSLTKAFREEKDVYTNDIWYMNAADAGTANIVVTTDAGRPQCADISITAVSYTEVGAYESYTSGDGYNGTATLSVNPTANQSLIFHSVISGGTGTMAPLDEQSEISDQSGTNFRHGVYEVLKRDGNSTDLDVDVDYNHWANGAVIFEVADTDVELYGSIDVYRPYDSKNLSCTLTVDRTYHWTGAGDGTDWHDGDNWGSGVVPTSNVDVVIDDTNVSSNQTVVATSNIEYNTLSISSSSYTHSLDLNSGANATGGAITGDSNSRIYGGTGTIYCSGDWSTATDCFDAESSTVEFTQDASILDFDADYDHAFYKMTIKEGVTLTLQHSISFASSPVFTMEADSVITGASYNVYVWSGNTIPFVLDSTADLTGINRITLWECNTSGSTLPANQYYPTISMKEGTDLTSTTLAGNVKINGDFTFGENGSDSYVTLDINGYNLHVTGDFNLGSGTNVGHLENGSSSATVTVEGNFTIASDDHSESNTFDGTSINLIVWGDFTNNGTFTAGDGLVRFERGDQTLTGSTTFYDFEKTNAEGDTLTFDNTATFTFDNSLTLAGCNLRSDSTGTQTSFVVGASCTTSLDNLDVQDNDASGGEACYATNTVDSGNNVNWVWYEEDNLICTITAAKTGSDNLACTITPTHEEDTANVLCKISIYATGGTALLSSISPTIRQRPRNLQENQPVFCYRIYDYDDEGSDLKLCEHPESITFKGVTYTPFPIRHQFIPQNVQGQVDQVTIEVANVNREMQAYLEQYEFRRRKVDILLVWADHLDKSEYYFKDTFYIDSYAANENIVEFTLKSKLDLMQVQLPGRTYSRNHCRWLFKSTECGYSGPQTSCNKTLQRCTELQNEQRFGGFPAIPSRRIIIS